MVGLKRKTDWRKAALASALAALLAGCVSGGGTEPAASQAGEQAPYAGYESREIAALAPERMDALLAGSGAGYALAAEVNGYPGPKHVLEFAERLELTEEQRAATEAMYAEMKERAMELGSRIVELERELDRAFKSGEASEEELARLTSDIAETEGRLRHVHLETHLRMREALTAEQTKTYNELRGYAGEGAAGHEGHGGGEHQAH